VPGRHVTFLVSPRKVTQRRRPGRRVLRCATDSLRFSKAAAAAELASALRSCSNSPRRLPRSFLRCSARPTGLCPWLCQHLSLAGLGRVGSLLPTDLNPWPDGHPRSPTRGCSGSRFVPLHPDYKNTCPASRSGIASQPCLQANTRAASSPTKIQRIEVQYRLHHHERAPVRSAEHRRLKRGSRRGLFESRPKADASSAAAASDEKHREPAAAGEGRVSSGRLFFGYFILAKQKKVSRPRDELPLKITARQRTTPAPRQIRGSRHAASNRNDRHGWKWKGR
jgi:hypothetical protein